MRERPRHRLVGAALILAAASLVTQAGCDNTVRILTVQLNPQKIYPVGAGYTSALAPGEENATCAVNPKSFDVKVLLLGNDKYRKLTLIREGDRLESCTFGLGNEDTGCAFNRNSVKISSTFAERLSRVCTRDADCDQNWSCNTVDGLCQAPISLDIVPVIQATANHAGQDFDFVVDGNVDDRQAKGRLIALVIDNSGSLHGDTSPPPAPLIHQATETDPNEERLAAASSFVRALDPSRDQVAVYALSGDGDTGVIPDTTFVSPGATKKFGSSTESIVLHAISELRNAETGGTPIWDGVVKAATDLRAVAGDHNQEYIPSIVLFTDGYKKQDKTGAEADQVYGSFDPPAGAGLDEALKAVQSSDWPIPVYIVHLENLHAVMTSLGRDLDLAEMGCASGGAYYYATDPKDVRWPFQEFFKYATYGYYRMRIGYRSLSADDATFPAGEDYAINAHFVVTLDKKAQGFDLTQKKGNLTGGLSYDARVFVTKPPE